jgi:hypothetical protein
MKKRLLFTVLTLPIILTSLSSCEGSSDAVPVVYQPDAGTAVQPVDVPVAEKIKFDGSFQGNANKSSFRLDISNIEGQVKGTMKDGENSFLLEGTVSGGVMNGTMKYILGDLPFQAYYQGPSLVLQLDKETMDALKLLVAAGSDNADALLADDKIVFDEK